MENTVTTYVFFEAFSILYVATLSLIFFFGQRVVHRRKQWRIQHGQHVGLSGDS